MLLAIFPVGFLLHSLILAGALRVAVKSVSGVRIDGFKAAFGVGWRLALGQLPLGLVALVMLFVPFTTLGPGAGVDGFSWAGLTAVFWIMYFVANALLLLFSTNFLWKGAVAIKGCQIDGFVAGVKTAAVVSVITFLPWLLITASCLLGGPEWQESMQSF